MGILYYILGEFDQAIKYWKDAVALNQSDYQLFSNIGYYHFFKKDLKLSLEYF